MNVFTVIALESKLLEKSNNMELKSFLYYLAYIWMQQKTRNLSAVLINPYLMISLCPLKKDK